jgi:hypothetical protein
MGKLTYHELNNNEASEYTEKVKKEAGYFRRVANENDIIRARSSNSLSDKCRAESNGGICSTKTDKTNPCPYKHYQWCIDETQGSSGFCHSSWMDSHNRSYVHISKVAQEMTSSYEFRDEIRKWNRKKLYC